MPDTKKSAKRIDAKRAAQNYYKRGMSFKAALVDAGATETQASKGKGLLTERAHLMRAFKSESERQIKRLQLVGQSMDGEGQTDFVRGTLMDVAVSGKGSERVAAASWLGKDKRCNLFAPDNAVNLYSLQIPATFESRYLSTTPTIDAEEITDAVAQADGMLTLNSFSPAKLASGTVTVPATIPTPQEPVPVPITDSQAEEESQ
jgi:hypothetical protein